MRVCFWADPQDLICSYFTEALVVCPNERDRHDLSPTTYHPVPRQKTPEEKTKVFLPVNPLLPLHSAPLPAT